MSADSKLIELPVPRNRVEVFADAYSHWYDVPEREVLALLSRSR